MDIWQEMHKTLSDLSAASLLRRPLTVQSAAGPTIEVGGRSIVCLCSNDYLCLAADPAVKTAAAEALQQWGVGSGASRLVSGTTEVHVRLEAALAAFKGTQAAVVTPTGWMANRVAIGALAAKGDLVLCDKLNHASILDAARASAAVVRTYPHKNLDRLETLLDRHRSGCRRCLIVTDSLFSMDGDLAPLAALADLKDRYDAQLLIDDAHATGVLGAQGRGAAELLGVEDCIDAVVGTLSKALGSLGGFVAGPKVLIDTIRNTGRAYIYTTAPPAALCAAAEKSLEIVRSQPHRREHLLALSARLREALSDAGFDIRGAAAQIIPIVIGPAAKALSVSAALLDAGFLIPAIRPPTVPPATSRLRISLCCGHTDRDINALVTALTAL